MIKSFRLSTCLLAGTLVLATATYGTAATKHSSKKPAASSSASMVSHGKALTQQYRCTGCHGANLKGKPGRTPNITASGGLKEYTKAKFEKVLATGVTADGGHLKGMPVFGMKAHDADAIYAYLQTLK
ncbi:MAG TPA: cytochrome c [Capsulimonadaceae bacterium]|nr:cytochrome c [Capsulimonadaceae bacterium]